MKEGFLAEQSVVLVSHHLVALADRRFEAAPVEYPNAASHVADEVSAVAGVDGLAVMLLARRKHRVMCASARTACFA